MCRRLRTQPPVRSERVFQELDGLRGQRRGALRVDVADRGRDLQGADAGLAGAGGAEARVDLHHGEPDLAVVGPHACAFDPGMAVLDRDHAVLVEDAELRAVAGRCVPGDGKEGLPGIGVGGNDRFILPVRGGGAGVCIDAQDVPGRADVRELVDGSEAFVDVHLAVLGGAVFEDGEPDPLACVGDAGVGAFLGAGAGVVGVRGGGRGLGGGRCGRGRGRRGAGREGEREAQGGEQVFHGFLTGSSERPRGV